MGMGPLRTGLDDSGDLPGFKAGGADIQAFGGTRNHGPHALDIRVPATLGASVRVRNGETPDGALSADVASGSHDTLPG